jgi:hypothetical protein
MEKVADVNNITQEEHDMIGMNLMEKPEGYVAPLKEGEEGSESEEEQNNEGEQGGEEGSEGQGEEGGEGAGEGEGNEGQGNEGEEQPAAAEPTSEQIDAFTAKKFPNKYSKFNDIETILSEYEKIKPEYETLKQSSNLIADVDETVLKVNSYMKATKSTDIATAMKLITSDLKTLDPLEKLTLAEQLNNPEADISKYRNIMKSKYSTDKDYLTKKLKLGDEYEKLEDNEKIEVDELAEQNDYELKSAANLAAKTIQSERDKIKLPQLRKPVTKEQQEKVITDWKPEFTKITTNKDGIKVKVTFKNKAGVDTTEELTIAPANLLDARQKSAMAAAKIVIDNMLEANPNNLKLLNDDVLNTSKMLIFDAALNEVFNRGRESGITEYGHQVFNNRPPAGKVNQRSSLRVLNDEEKEMARVRALNKKGHMVET